MVDRNEISQELAKTRLLESAELLKRTAENCLEPITAAANLIAAAFKAGRKLLLCGNGGSAADCQHMAAEFVSCLTRDFVRPALPAIALTTDTSFLTAFANDTGFDGVFARQIEALANEGDVLLGISTSGSSKNILLAAEAGHQKKMLVIILSGEKISPAMRADVVIAVPGANTQHIQENHLAIEHIICELVEQSLFTGGK